MCLHVKTVKRTLCMLLSMLLLLAPFSLLPAQEGREAEFLGNASHYLSMGDFRKAAKAFEEAAKINPDNVEAHKGVGTSYMKLGSGDAVTFPDILEKATAAFHRALLIDPDLSEVRYNLAMTYLSLHNKSAATREYEILLKSDPKLAEQLSAAITSHELPPSYHETGRPVSEESNQTRVTIDGNRVLVPITFRQGDRAVQVNLLLDTGATTTTISPGTASRLGIDMAKAAKITGQVFGGGIIEGRSIRMDSTTVGPHTRTGMRIDVVPHIGPPVRYDGLLGMDFLRGLKYHVDFKNQLINWVK